MKVYNLVDYYTKEVIKVFTAYNIATTLYYLNKYHNIRVSSYSQDNINKRRECEFQLYKREYKECIEISDMLHKYVKSLLDYSNPSSI